MKPIVDNFQINNLYYEDYNINTINLFTDIICYNKYGLNESFASEIFKVANYAFDYVSIIPDESVCNIIFIFRMMNLK